MQVAVAPTFALPKAVQFLFGGMPLKRRTTESAHMEVRPAGKSTGDNEIARRARVAVAWHTHSPDAAIDVQVTNGRVTLTGTVEDVYERLDIEAAVKKLDDVAQVSNLIEIGGASSVVNDRGATVAKDGRVLERTCRP